jgi:hypothetical protein
VPAVLPFRRTSFRCMPKVCPVPLRPHLYRRRCCRYTGEDGFELSIPNDSALELCEALMADSRVRMCGLGPRDSLRLEAGLCLYGEAGWLPE